MAETDRTLKRRHHTVPAFYLRGFADGERLLTIALPGTRRFTQMVKDASVATDFYAIPGHKDGDDVLEEALADLEGKAAPVIARIVARRPLLPGDRGTLAYYIAVQAARSPAQKRNADALKAQMARFAIGLAGRERFGDRFSGIGKQLTERQLDELWKQAMRPEGPPLEVSTTEFAAQMVGTAQQLVPYIAGRPWTFIHFGDEALITSDDPVTLIPRENANPSEGIGYGTAGEIMMPISRRVALVMGDLDEAASTLRFEDVGAGTYDAVRLGTAEVARLVNEHTALSASKWIFAHPADEKSVPSNLPAPNPVSLRMSSAGWKFDGSPGGRTEDEASTGTADDAVDPGPEAPR